MNTNRNTLLCSDVSSLLPAGWYETMLLKLPPKAQE